MFEAFITSIGRIDLMGVAKNKNHLKNLFKSNEKNFRSFDLSILNHVIII